MEILAYGTYERTYTYDMKDLCKQSHEYTLDELGGHTTNHRLWIWMWM